MSIHGLRYWYQLLKRDDDDDGNYLSSNFKNINFHIYKYDVAEKSQSLVLPDHGLQPKGMLEITERREGWGDQGTHEDDKHAIIRGTHNHIKK